MNAHQRFGAELRTLRQSAGVGQKVVAHRAGITVASVSLIERGQRNASIDVLCAVAQAVGYVVVLKPLEV